MNISNVETIKYLINTDLFIYLKNWDTSRYQVFDGMNTSASMPCLWSPVIAKAMMSNEAVRKNVTQSWPWRQTDDGRYIPARLSVYPWAFLIFIANTILMGNRILHSLKRRVGSDGHNWIVDIRIVFLELVTIAAIQHFCKYIKDYVLTTTAGQGKLTYFT